MYVSDEEPAVIRLLCTVTEAPGELWGDMGFDYYEALYAAGLPIRIFSNGAAMLASGRWEPHGADFLRPLAPRHVNVMIAPLASIFIALGQKNAAITMATESPLPTNKRVVVSLCTVLGAPTRGAAKALRALGLEDAAEIIPSQLADRVAGLWL